MDKGFLAEIIPLAISLFLISFVVIVFLAWIEATITDRASIITSASSKSNIQYEILAFLQTPLELDSEFIPISDSLIIFVENPKYTKQIKKQVEFYLSNLPLPKEKCVWKLLFSDAEKELFKIESSNILDSKSNNPLSGNLFFIRSSNSNEELHSFQIPSYNNPGKFYLCTMGVECEK